MSNKRAVPIFCLLLLLFLPGLGKAEKFSLKLSGGMSCLLMGDINKGIKGIIDAWNDFIVSQGSYVRGEVKLLHLSYDLEGTVIINLTPKIGIGFGVGYIKGTKTSEITSSGSIEGIYTNNLKIQAIPFMLGVFYTLPIRERINVFFNAGVGIYLAQCNYDCGFIGDLIGTLPVHVKSSSEGLGFHGGVEFEFRLASNLSFVFEGQGRYVKIGGFEGTVSDYPWPNSSEGTIYYYEETTITGTYPMIGIFENKPPFPKIREARVDFSGITFLAGIKIKL